MNISEVKELNARIEKIQTQRTKLETKREMLLADLSAVLQTYADMYGVDLRRGKISETRVAVEEEKSRIEGIIQQEFDLKSKVVSAIESGDIATAKKLLGVEEVESSGVEGGGTTETEEEVDLFGSEEEVTEDESSEVEEEVEGEVGEVEEEDEEEGIVLDDVDEGDSDWGDLFVDEESDEGSKPVATTGKSFLEAVAKADSKPSKVDTEVEVKEEEEEDLDDFGFGSITKGTKFGKN